MAYAFVNDIAASWEHYGNFAAALEGSIPEGLVLHAAGPTDEGFRIIEVWESEDAWERFRADRLLGDPAADTHVRPVFRALRPAHVVVRGADGSWRVPARGSSWAEMSNQATRGKDGRTR